LKVLVIILINLTETLELSKNQGAHILNIFFVRIYIKLSKCLSSALSFWYLKNHYVTLRGLT